MLERVRAMALLVAVVSGGAPALAQDYTACFLTFDGNPSGKNVIGCPSRIFLTLDSTNINFVIGGVVDPNDPNVLDPNLCATGLVSPPVTDDEVRDFTQQVLESETNLYVRAIGDTGLLIRKQKGPANLNVCGISTNDSSLRIRSLQLDLPALLIDLDHVVDADDDGASGLTTVTVDVNGMMVSVPVDSTDPDHLVALDVVNQLNLDGYTVVYGGGTGIAVTRTPGNTAVLTGSVSVGGNLTGLGVVPPICTGLSPPSGICGLEVTLEGAGFTPGMTVLFGAEAASVGLITDLAESQTAVVRPVNRPEGTEELTVSVAQGAFDDCCPIPFVISCANGVTRNFVRVTRNGPPSEPPDSFEFHLTSTEHAGPPVLSDCSTDSLCSSGAISCSSATPETLAGIIANSLRQKGCPPGVNIFACGDLVGVVNNKDITGREIFLCVSIGECPGGTMGYGLSGTGSINNVCSGVCGDEDQPPGAFGYNFELVSELPCFAGISQILDSSGDGTNALLVPEAIDVDSEGNVYVTGRGSNNAFKIETNGTITQLIDSTGDGTNPLTGAFGIVFDELTGNTYVSGRDSNNVFRISEFGMITQVADAAGDGGTFPMLSPRHLAPDGLGNIFVAAHDSNTVFVITIGGSVVAIMNSIPDGINPLTGPCHVFVDQSDLYVSGAISNNVFLYEVFLGFSSQIIDSTGDGSNSLSQPQGITVDSMGNIYVAGRNSDNVFQITLPSTITEVLDSTGAGAGQMFAPGGLAVDGSDNVYVTSSVSNTVLKLSSSGAVDRVADVAGDGTNPLAGITGIAVDTPGNVFFAGGLTANVFKFENCRAGNVNAGIGLPTNVLFVNGSPGVGPDRRVVVSRTAALSIDMMAPPSLAMANFACYAYVGDASPSTGRDLPMGIGTFCMPTPLSDSTIPPLLTPLEIWNNLGFTGLLGVPTRVAASAPTTFVNLPAGTQRSLTVFLQAIIRDDNSPQGQVAVSNGVLLITP